MNEKYNDHELMSPEQMEIIAKQYKNQIKHKNKLKEVAIMYNLSSLFEELFIYYETLKFVFPSKCYRSNIGLINKHIDILIDMASVFNHKKTINNKPRKVNYFRTLKEIIDRLLKLFKIYWNELRDEHNSKVIFSLIEQIIELY